MYDLQLDRTYGSRLEHEVAPKATMSEDATRESFVREGFETAQSAEEWRATLRLGAQIVNDEPEEETVHIVCEKLHGQSIKKLTMVIFESLKDEPLNRETYVFCNKCGNVIITI